MQQEEGRKLGGFIFFFFNSILDVTVRHFASTRDYIDDTIQQQKVGPGSAPVSE